MKHTIADVIERMLQLLDSPEKWARGNLAYDHDRATSATSSSATSWCLLGAAKRVSCHWVAYRPTVAFLGQRARAEYGGELVEVNDGYLKDYEDMRMFLKRALLEAEENK